MSTTGEITPFGFTPSPMNDTFKAELQSRINAAKEAKQEAYTDVTPMYWQAEKGQHLTMAFMGFKPINKKNEAGEVIGSDFAIVFFDGDREIVCNQIALKDAMKTKTMGKVYKITCIEAVKKQAKKFEVLEFND